MDFEVKDGIGGRVEFELYADCPKTSENFRALCTGEKGKGFFGKPLHYKGSKLHRLLPELLVQGGDFVKGDGTSGESIYGPFFQDENFSHKHDKPFLLGMSNMGDKGTNSSQFYMTVQETIWLDHNNVCFGEVVAGKDVVYRLSLYG
jgi:peptidylprolyl isomerase